MPYRKTTRPRRFKKRRTYRKKTNIKKLNYRVKKLESVTDKNYCYKEQHYFPGVAGHITEYHCRAMIRPDTMQPLWKLASINDLSQTGKKVCIKNITIRGAVSVGSEMEPINFDLFVFKLRNKFRSQMSQLIYEDPDLNTNALGNKILLPDIDYMQQNGPVQGIAAAIPPIKNQFTFMNMKKWEVKKHLHFRLGNETLGPGLPNPTPGLPPNPVVSQNLKDTVKDFSFKFKINKTLTCDDDDWKGTVGGIKTWQVPAYAQYYVCLFSDNSAVDLQSPGIYLNSIISTERG